MSIPQTPSPLANIVAAKTYNAQWFSGSTKEAQIQAAITAAVADGALYVYVPANMLPYNASLVTFNSAIRMLREGGDPSVLDVLAYGVAGDGVTDDTAAIQAAENARLAGQILQLPSGKTYLVNTAGNAANCLRVKVSGVWDFAGATIKYGGSTNLTIGSDSQALGLISVLAADTRIRGGTINVNQKAAYAVAYLQTTSGHFLDCTITQGIEAAGQPWSKVWWQVSTDISGIAVGGNITNNVAGILRLPNCPISLVDVIQTHLDVTAYLIGGSNPIIGNTTSAALVSGFDNTGMYLHIPTTIGIEKFNNVGEANTHFWDLHVHDVGTQAIEVYGSSIGIEGLPATAYPGVICKQQVAFGQYHYNVVGASTVPPNVFSFAGSTVQAGQRWLAGQDLLGNQKPAAGATFTVDLSKGNDFVFPTNNAATTVNAPTNPAANPTGLTLTQIFCVTIQNASGGATTTTWNAAYHLAGAWVDPANTKQRSIWFRYDIPGAVAYEIARSAADVTT